MAAPNAFAQYMLELTNRARLDPWGEFDRLVTYAPENVRLAIDYFNVDLVLLRQQFFALEAVAPLVWNEELAAAAAFHTQVMINFDGQSHQFPGEPSVGQRIIDAGYEYSYAGENIYAYAEDTLYGHAGFFVDWGYTLSGIQDPAGHRVNIMDARFQEIGIGYLYEANPATEVGPHVITQDFGTRRDYAPQITGVILDDRDGDRFYDIGEGVGGASIIAVGSAGTYTSTTWDAGGYNLAVPAGAYQVTFSYGGRAWTTNTVVGGENVKVDAFLADMGGTVDNGTRDSLYDVSRFYNPATGAHFYTASDAERDMVLASNQGFTYEGNAFDSGAGPADGVAIYRFYNDQTGVHFYTASEQERDTINRSLPAFHEEGVAYYAYTSGADDLEALYRFYNTQTGTHFYTVSEEERDSVQVSLPQFQYEGVAFYVEIA